MATRADWPSAASAKSAKDMDLTGRRSNCTAAAQEKRIGSLQLHRFARVDPALASPHVCSRSSPQLLVLELQLFRHVKGSQGAQQLMLRTRNKELVAIRLGVGVGILHKHTHTHFKGLHLPTSQLMSSTLCLFASLSMRGSL